MCCVSAIGEAAVPTVSLTRVLLNTMQVLLTKYLDSWIVYIETCRGQSYCVVKPAGRIYCGVL
jgi:hypothetical protein